MANPKNSVPAQSPGWRIVRNGGWLLGGKTVGAILSVVYLAMITRSLGPEGFGRFALTFSFAQAVGGLISFQTGQIIIRYGTPLVLKKADDDFAQLIWICLMMDTLGVIAGSGLTVLCVLGLSVYYGWGIQIIIQIIVFTVVMLLATRGTSIGILRVHDRFRDAALADTLVPIIRFAGVGVGLLFGPTIIWFLAIWVMSEITATAIMWAVIWRTVPIRLAQQRIRSIPEYYRKYPDLTRFAGFTNLTSSLRIMSQQIIVLVVGFYAGAAAAGFFRLGHQLGQVLARIADGLSFTVFAEYNRITNQDGAHAARSMIGNTMRVTLISAAILLMILTLSGKYLITKIFGVAYLPAYPLVLLLGGAAAVQVGAMALEPVLITHGKAGWVLLCNLAGAVTMALLLIILMPTYSVVGAGIAVVSGALITALFLSAIYRR